MRYILFTATLIVMTALSAWGQNNQAKSIAYYYAAEELFESSNYDEALTQLEKSVEAGGGSNATIEALRAQCYAGKKDWIMAKKTLDKCYAFNPKADILKKLSSVIITVDDEYEKALEVERQRKEQARQEELARLKREEEKKLAAQQLENKKNNIAAALSPEFDRQMDVFNQLEEGRPYLVTYRNSLTSSSSEKAVLIFYGNEYIIYTIPSVEVAKKLKKETISFTGWDANHGDGVIHMKIKPDYGDKRETHFKKGIHYSNVFLGGFGDELMWTSGEQYLQFDKTLYYYYYYNTLHCDIEMNTSFSEHYYNPYIETGLITKTIDYDLVNDSDVEQKLRNAGVGNKPTSNLDAPAGLEIRIKPSQNMKMLFPQKKITYALKDKLKGEYISNNTEYKGTFLYFVPSSSSSHYGFMQFGKYYGEADLLTSITEISSSYRMPQATFNSIYKAFSEDVGNGDSRYFTSSDYTTFFNAIPELIQ